MLKWLRYLNPNNIILIKRLVDAIEVVVRLIEQIFPNSNPNRKPSDTEKD